MIKIPEMTEQQRAFRYPYDAPDGSFLITSGHCTTLDDDYDFSGRIAVLSVGSNRAPAQLYRKFGPQAELPVTPVRMHDCDIVHVANFAPYGAVPCSACYSQTSAVMLNIAWLDDVQLEVMHSTESLGDAYDFIKCDDGYAEHLHPRQIDSLYGYASRKGALSLSGQGPFGLAAIPAENRQFASLSQYEALARLKSRFAPDAASTETWVEQIQTQPEYRNEIADILAAEAILPTRTPWQVVAEQITPS